jgi:hypothetical protein
MKFVVAVLLVSCSWSAQAQQIWFDGLDDLNGKDSVAYPEFPRLFSTPSDWSVGLANTSVLRFRIAYLLKTPMPKLAPMLAFLKDRGIAVAAAVPLMPAAGCGSGVEGMSSTKQVIAYAHEAKARNIELSYVAMDEPLYNGHDDNSERACRWPVDRVAKGVAQSVRSFRNYYPNVQFVQIEPVQTLGEGTRELDRFLNVYADELNEAPASLELDVHWERRTWPEELLPFIELARSHRIGYGVIYNATFAPEAGYFPGSDGAWITSAKENISAFETNIKTKPDHVAFATWNPFPKRLLPETDPTTMTGLIRWYVSRLEHKYRDN